MMARVMSATLVGVDACRVTVEVDLINRLPMMHTVGLAARPVKESEDRVRAAIGDIFGEFPKKRIIINLAPADLPKNGTGFDLPIAVGILRGWGKVEGNRADGFLMLGELGLNGLLRPVPGVLAAALAAREGGLEGIIVPWSNREEAGLVDGLEVVGASTLHEVMAFLNGAELTGPAPAAPGADTVGPAQWFFDEPDLSEVRGLEWPRLALEVAAAGGHNLMFVGPPGTGKPVSVGPSSTVVPASGRHRDGECGDGGRLLLHSSLFVQPTNQPLPEDQDSMSTMRTTPCLEPSRPAGGASVSFLWLSPHSTTSLRRCRPSMPGVSLVACASKAIVDG